MNNYQCRKCGKKDISYRDVVIDIKHNGKKRPLCKDCFLKEMKQLYGLEEGSTVYSTKSKDYIDKLIIATVYENGIIANDGWNRPPQFDDSFTTFYPKDIGKTIFLTREDAEKQARKNIESRGN